MNEQQIFEAVFKATGVQDFERAIGSVQESMGSLKSASDKVKNIGKDLTKKLTAPIIGLGTASVLTYGNFESSMNKVAAISGATGDELQKMTDIAEELGNTTKFSASEAADGMSFLAMAGFEVSEVIETMPGLLNLASAAGLDLASTADITSNILTGFGLGADESGRMVDVLAAASSSANTDVAQLGEAMAYVAPVAQGAGLSLEEMSAAVGMLGDAGIQGGKAGTTLTAIIAGLQNPTGDSIEVMKELGLSMEDLDPSTQSLANIMRTLEDSGMDSAQAMRYFGRQAGPGITAMLSQSSARLADFTSELENSNGTAEEMADIMNSGLAGSFNDLKSALEGVAIQFGRVLAPIIDAITGKITDLVRWFSELSPEIKTAMVVVGALAASIGPLLMFIGQMGLGVSALGTFFVGTAGSASMFATILGALTSPVALVIAGIAALVAVMVYLYKTNETVREAINTAWQFIKDLIMQAVGVISDYVQSVIGGLVTWWQENNEMILQAAQNVWNAIKSVIEVVMNVISSIMQTLWPMIMAVVKFAWDGIKNIIDGTIKVITGIIEFFSALFTGNWSAMWDAVKQIVSGAVQAIWGFIQLWIVGKIIGAVKAFAGLLKSLFSSAWAFVKNIFSSSLSWIGGKVSSGLGAIKGTFTTIFNSLKGIVSNAFNAVKSAVTGGMNNAWNVVKGFFGKFKTAGSNIVGSIADGIKGAIGKVTGAISGVVSKVRDFLPFSPAKEGPLRDLDKLNFGGTIADSIYDGENTIQRAMNRALNMDMGVMNGQVSHSVNMGTGKTEAILERTHNLLERIAEGGQVIVLDSGELVGATYPQYDRVGGSQTQLTERWGR